MNRVLANVERLFGISRNRGLSIVGFGSRSTATASGSTLTVRRAASVPHTAAPLSAMRSSPRRAFAAIASGNGRSKGPSTRRTPIVSTIGTAARELWDRVRRHLEASLESGASMQLDQLLVGAAFDLQSPAAIAWMNAKRRAYWDGAVNDTTKDRLSEALGRVMADGPTPEKLAEAVRTVFEGETEGREKGYRRPLRFVKYNRPHGSRRGL